MKEQPIETIVGGMGTSTSIEVITPIISQMAVSTTLPEVAISPP